jgi:hypothetical protein
VGNSQNFTKVFFYSFPVELLENIVFLKKKNVLFLSSDPALYMKEVKKNENEKCTSRESVIIPVFKKADSLTGSLLCGKNGCSLSEMHQDEAR